jgi:hypothetical protein
MFYCYLSFMVCFSLNILYYNVLYPSQGVVLKNEYQKCLDALYKMVGNDAYLTSKVVLFSTFFAFWSIMEYPRFFIIRYFQSSFEAHNLMLFVSSALLHLLFNHCLTYFNILKTVPIAETANTLVYSLIFLTQYFIIHFVAYRYDNLLLNVSFRVFETIFTAMVVK